MRRGRRERGVFATNCLHSTLLSKLMWWQWSKLSILIYSWNKTIIIFSVLDECVEMCVNRWKITGYILKYIYIYILSEKMRTNVRSRQVKYGEWMYSPMIIWVHTHAFMSRTVWYFVSLNKDGVEGRESENDNLHIYCVMSVHSSNIWAMLWNSARCWMRRIKLLHTMDERAT